MLKSVKGVYKNGKIELFEQPFDIAESTVIVTFLELKPDIQSSQMMSFGMFAGGIQSAESDFSAAEWNGDSDDNLDWS